MNIARYLILLALFSLTIDANADCQVVNGWQNRPLIFNFPNQFVVPNSLPMVNMKQR